MFAIIKNGDVFLKMSVLTLVMRLKNVIAGTAAVRDVIEKYEWVGREQSTSFQIQKVFS